MKRDIEIVNYNSCNKTSSISRNGKFKHEFAQELFEKEMFPMIGK